MPLRPDPTDRTAPATTRRHEAASCSRSPARWSSASGSWPPAGRRRSCRSPGSRSSARLVGLVVVVLPLVLQRRLRLTRAALPLVVIAGVGEILGSMLSAWGSRESIPITAVMGSQFAAIAAVAAFLLFGERLGRMQVAGVVLIVVGVTLLAAVTA